MWMYTYTYMYIYIHIRKGDVSGRYPIYICIHTYICIPSKQPFISSEEPCIASKKSYIYICENETFRDIIHIEPPTTMREVALVKRRQRKIIAEGVG